MFINEARADDLDATDLNGDRITHLEVTIAIITRGDDDQFVKAFTFATREEAESWAAEEVAEEVAEDPGWLEAQFIEDSIDIRLDRPMP